MKPYSVLFLGHSHEEPLYFHELGAAVSHALHNVAKHSYALVRYGAERIDMLFGKTA